MKNAAEIQTQNYADLNYPSKKQFRAFPSYAFLSSFAERWSCKNILEIGGGLSTAVWADLAQRTGADVYSIDADFSRMKSYVRNTPHEIKVSKHINLIEGTTISSEEFLDFYSTGPHRTYGGIEIAKCMDYLDTFQHRNCSMRRRHLVSRNSDQGSWSPRDLLIKDSALLISRQLLDVFSYNGNFDNVVSFLRDTDSEGRGNKIEELISHDTCWDIIFFDSGELSSMIEWTKLKEQIAIGGFAAFHDIFFPKSIKNIVPCAALAADPDWDIVFCDDSTKQGLLIAQKLR